MGEAPSNEVIVIGRSGETAAQASGSKREVADAVWDAVVAARRQPTRGARQGRISMAVWSTIPPLLNQILSKYFSSLIR